MVRIKCDFTFADCHIYNIPILYVKLLRILIEKSFDVYDGIKYFEVAMCINIEVLSY